MHQRLRSFYKYYVSLSLSLSFMRNGPTTVGRHLESSQPMLLEPLRHSTAVKVGRKHPGWKLGSRLGLAGEGIRSPLQADCADGFVRISGPLSCNSVTIFWLHEEKKKLSVSKSDGPFQKTGIARTSHLPLRCWCPVTTVCKLTVQVCWSSKQMWGGHEFMS